MFELIVFIIIIVAITTKNKKKQNTSRSSSRQNPSIPLPPEPKKPAMSPASVTRQVNQRIYGTDNPKDRVTIYNRLILTDRYQDMEKMAHELGISKFKVLREIQELQREGHYKTVTIDEKNYRLIYSDAEKKARMTAPKQSETPREERTFVQPTKAYRPARNAAERYEEWFPIPEGKEVCRCGYCGADNLIPSRGSRSQYTCYFCREEL